jgi:phosphatidylinositol alpha-1,6-mannosyltransferase
MPDALLVTSSFLPGSGGIESFLATLCDVLAPRVAVLAPPRRDGRALPRDLPYETIAGPPAMQWPRRKVLDAIVASAHRLGTDRILFGTPWPLGLLGPSVAARGLRYAAIVHGAELLVPAAIPLLGRRLGNALARAELLLPVSAFTESKVRAAVASTGQPRPPIERLYARVDLHRWHPAAGAGVRHGLGLSGAPVVLCLGRLVRRKGVHRLIDLMPRIEQTVPGAVLVVAGTGPQERALRRRAAGRGRVIFTGRVPESDAPGLVAAADVFAFPVADRWGGLDTEGLGVVLLEAAACETPCVTGRSGGTPEAVIDGVTGYVVDARDGDALVERIGGLLADPSRAAEMGKRARAHVAKTFSADLPPAPLVRWLA